MTVIMMFNLRHIQLIVVLTDKDEKTWEKFHERHGFFADSFMGQAARRKLAFLAEFPQKSRAVGMVQIGLAAVMLVNQFDARGG